MGRTHAKNVPAKTLGTQGARLVSMLYERGRVLFSHADVEAITGLAAKSARSLVAGLVNRGLATRLQPGLFILVPPELGREREYLGNPYLVARELADTPDYYVSHASAMDLHRMVTQPQLTVFVTSPKAIRPRTVLGTEFRFVRCRPRDLFGIGELWVTKTERVRVSDLERTVIDGLRLPEHCGGFTEVAKGFWMRRDAIAIPKLVDYALRLGVGAVVRRLGLLLETFEIDAPAELARLRAALSATYATLDPTLPAEGPWLSRWRLRLNVEPDELRALVGT
ncbi:MAG: transcriptional regulator [Deltaproteobacteria bacterium]|nr:transcriptional regulator [Deltaproteobacteria bacterium]